MSPLALIVEDEPEANKLLSVLVQLRGYRTASAFGGREALAKIERETPDIVFLDLMLPDVNGHEVCRSIKSRKQTSLIPVVIVTARVAARNRLESFARGADDYVAKPYTPDQIYQALEDAEAWSRQIDARPTTGNFPLAEPDEADTARHLARLRNLLVARTSLTPTEAAELGALLTRLSDDAREWARRHDTIAGPRVVYALESDHFLIRFRDMSGWLGPEPFFEARWGREFGHLGFAFRKGEGDHDVIALVRTLDMG